MERKNNNMTISAKVIKDSISFHGVRITTLELTYHRWILSELNTHRMFSRNSASSRAIPVKTMIANIRNAPATPIHWGENKPGMQAGEEIANIEAAKLIWAESAELACQQAEKLAALNVHKQVVNRLTEPFMMMKTLVTSTEFENFFTLRDHPDAQPEIQELARQMKIAMDFSKPKTLGENQWHLPYVREDEEQLDLTTQLKISSARCARVSYLTHDGQNPDYIKDVALYERLAISWPPHLSPLEHQAKPAVNQSIWSGNFRGWIQHRKIFEKGLK